MLDVSHLTQLSAALEQSIEQKDIETIQQLCIDNDDLIRSIKPLTDPADNAQIKYFIMLHQSATQLVRDVRVEMQKQLYQTNKTRKGVKQYKGVKHAK